LPIGRIHYFAEVSYNKWDLEHFIKWNITNFGEINTETNKVFYEILTIISYDSNTSKEVDEIARKLLSEKSIIVQHYNVMHKNMKVQSREPAAEIRLKKPRSVAERKTARPVFDIKNSAHLWENKPSTVLQDITNISSKRVHSDKTTEICHALLQPFNTVPKNAEDLPLLIKAPLECKLLVAANEEIKSPELQELFLHAKRKEGVTWQYISPAYLMITLNQGLKIFFKEHLGEDYRSILIGIDLIRDQQRGLKGKEKADIDQLDIAKSELISKLNVIDSQKF
ncbi:26014_t:CDS:2, partial [Gigaspora rosea]